jgi:hypothetical protein
VAGRILCNSRAYPASKFPESIVRSSAESKFSIVPATGLHSESNWFHVRPSEGYLQSKDLQAGRSFLNFLSSVSGCLKCNAESGVLPRNGRPYCCARQSAQPKSDVIPNRAESPVRNLLLGLRQLSCRRSQTEPSRCGNHLEILWEARIDRIKRRTYVCKVSRTVGFAWGVALACQPQICLD